MGTTAEKLTYLNDTKQLLKDSINSLGGEITSQTTFRQYATELDSIYSNLPKVSGTGTSVNLTPTLKGRLESILKGNTFQQTYTGKNLFDKSSTPNFVDNGCTYEILNTGIRAKLTANSDGVKYVRYVVMNLDGLENQKITAYAKVKPSNSQNARFTIGTCNSTGGNRNVLVQSAFVNTETPQTITGTVPSTLDSTNNYLYILLYGATASGIASGTYIDFEDLMIVKGEYTTSTIGSYEPYVGGTASPNPDYPQEIVSATGRQKISVWKKNLFDIADGTYKSNDELASITFTNGVMTNFTYSQTSSFGIIIPLRTPITLNANQSYTRGNNSGMSYPYITLYNQNKASMDTMAGSDNGVRTYTPTEQKEVYYIYLWFDYRLTYTNFKPMMNIGSTLEPFEKYEGQTKELNLGTIKLNKIGDYQDYIYKDSDKWYLHKEINIVVLDGVNNKFDIRQTTNNNSYFRFEHYLTNNGLTYTNAQIPDLFSDKLVKNSNNNVYSRNQGIGVSINGGRLNIYADDIAQLTLVNANTWLESNNISVYYVLATPTNTEITYQPLIDQLNEIYYLQSYNGTTNITITSEDLELIMTASALKGE